MTHPAGDEMAREEGLDPEWDRSELAEIESQGIPWRNTYRDSPPYATAEAARDACIAYVKECLGKSGAK